MSESKFIIGKIYTEPKYGLVGVFVRESALGYYFQPISNNWKGYTKDDDGNVGFSKVFCPPFTLKQQS